jgi:hypothetical protein
MTANLSADVLALLVNYGAPAETLTFNVHVDPVALTYSYATAAGSTYNGQALAVSSSGAFDSGAGQWNFSGTDSLGAGSWTSSGMQTFTDPRGGRRTRNTTRRTG